MIQNENTLSTSEILETLTFTRNINYFISLPDSLKDNVEFIQRVLALDVYYFKYISDRLKNNLDIVHSVVLQSGSLLEEAGTLPRSNVSIVSMACAIYPTAIKFASDEIKDDPDIIKRVMVEEPTLFEYASSRLKNDKAFVLSAILQNGYNFTYVSETLKNDKEVALAALGNYPQGFMLVNFELQNDIDVVTLAVKNDGNMLAFAGEAFKADLGLILEAVHITPSYIEQIEDISLRENQSVKYISNNFLRIYDEDWPLVKKALLVNPDDFINPPDVIKSIMADVRYPYKMLAQYALSKDAILEPESYPEIN